MALTFIREQRRGFALWADEKAFVHAVSNQGTFDIKAGMPTLTPSLQAGVLKESGVCEGQMNLC